MSHYENLKNHFWELRRQVSFSSVDADVYDYLIYFGCIVLGKSTFRQSNALICGLLGISEKTLIASRNRLKQAGLIEFKSGHKKQPSSYKLHWKFSSENNSINDSVFDSESGSNTPDILNTVKKVNTTPTPTREEVLQYAKEKAIDGKLAEKFWLTYQELNWIITDMHGNKRRLFNWETKLAMWVLEEQSKPKNNGTTNKVRRAASPAKPTIDETAERAARRLQRAGITGIPNGVAHVPNGALGAHAANGGR